MYIDRTANFDLRYYCMYIRGILVFRDSVVDTFEQVISDDDIDKDMEKCSEF